MEKELKPLLPVGTRAVPKLPTHRLRPGDYFGLAAGTVVWSTYEQADWKLGKDASCCVSAVCYQGDLVFFSIERQAGDYACELPAWEPGLSGNPAAKKQPREKQPPVEETWFRQKLASLVEEHGAESVYESAVQILTQNIHNTKNTL